MKQLNWGICGIGWIGTEMTEALKKSGKSVYGICSTHPDRTEAFAKKHDIPHPFDSYEEMIQDPAIDIVYIATPHNLHYKQMKEALLAGKNVFCEKAITVNSRQLEECVQIAKEKKLVISDGVTLLHMPLYKKLDEIVRSGKLGKIKMIQVNFGSCKEYDVNNRFFSKNLAGGALLDIGVYAVSFVRWFMESQPDVMLTTASFLETGVDETSGIILKNEDGQMATISLTMRAKQPKRGVVAGEKGYIEVDLFPRADQAKIVWTESGETEIIHAGNSADALVYEAQDMEDYINNGTGERNLDLVRDVMKTLTSVRNAWGMVYPFE